MRTRSITTPSVLAPLVLALTTGCVTTEIGGQAPADLTRQAETRRDVGIDHLTKGRTALAIRNLLESVEQNPEDYESQLWLGEAYRRRGLTDLAEDHLLTAIELASRRHRPRINLAALYLQVGRYEESIVQSNVLIDDPTFAALWQALTNRGWAYFKMDQPSQARVSYEEALEFHPTYWPALLNLGILESSLGRRLEALERFQQVLLEHPSRNAQAEANFRIGEAFVSLGRRDRALTHFANAIEVSPYGRWGKQSQKYLKLLR